MSVLKQQKKVPKRNVRDVTLETDSSKKHTRMHAQVSNIQQCSVSKCMVMKTENENKRNASETLDTIKKPMIALIQRHQPIILKPSYITMRITTKSDNKFCYLPN